MKSWLILTANGYPSEWFTLKEQAEILKGKDPDYSQRNLLEAISRGKYPKWTLNIQVMTNEQAKNFKWNPFDLTKDIKKKIHCIYLLQPQ